MERMQCGFCDMMTGGSHEAMCPNNPLNTGVTSYTTGPQGWTCPKCGNVYAPFVQECNRCNYGYGGDVTA